MEPATAYALYQGGKAVVNYAVGSQNRTPKFKNTEYGKYLARVSKEGIYTPKAKGIVQGEVNRQAGAVAQDAQSTYQGRLISKGMDHSIAGARGANEIDIARQREVAKTARQITLANEQSKVDAERQYALGVDKNKAMRRQESHANTMQLVNGLIDAGGPAIQKHFADSHSRELFSNALSTYRDAGDNGDPAQLYYDLFNIVNDKDAVLAIMAQLVE